MPKVSVLMPVYKTNEKYLREAIDSSGDELPYVCERVLGFINSGKIQSFDKKNGVLEKYLTLILSFIYKHKITDKKETIKILGNPVYKKNKKKEEM